MAALLFLQLLTGLLLMTAYAPASTTAWGSVWYIQEQLPQGWLLRGMHVIATDALILALALYLGIFLIRGPIETTHRWLWWTVLGLFGFVLLFALTGYLLPYDQRAYWGTVVRTNILGRVPYIGETLKGLMLAGDAPGTMALTRMYTLHVAILPILMTGFWWIVRRRICRDMEVESADARRSPEEIAARQTEAPGGENQKHSERAHGFCTSPLERALIHTVTLLALVAWVVLRHHHLGRSDLEAPADPTAADYPARPEWWALPFYQFLKYFPTPASETFAAVIVPGLMAGLMVILPLLPATLKSAGTHRWLLRGAALLIVLVAGLSAQALWTDWRADAPYRRAHAGAVRDMQRANELAQEHGIPPEGALALLHNDALTRGPRLFALHCASCHRINGQNGLGDVPAEPPTSSDLGGFATQPWIRGLLTDPMHVNYFGRMKNADGEPAHTKMQEWTAEQRDAAAEPDARARLERDFDLAAAYLADEAIQPGRLASLDLATLDESESDPVRLGRRVFMQTCNECHSYNGERTGTFSAPDMHGYGSPDWLELMIASPDHELRYRSKGRERAIMPPFRDRLSAQEIRLLAEWLATRRDVPSPMDSSKVK